MFIWHFRKPCLINVVELLCVVVENVVFLLVSETGQKSFQQAHYVPELVVIVSKEKHRKNLSRQREWKIFLFRISTWSMEVLFTSLFSKLWQTDGQTNRTYKQKTRIQREVTISKTVLKKRKIEVYIHIWMWKRKCVCVRGRENERVRESIKKYQIIYVFFTINILVVEVSRGLPVPLMYLYL